MPTETAGSASRVVLTSLREEDKERMFVWINDPETVRFNAAFSPVSWEAHEAWFANAGSRPGRIFWVIREAAEGPALGALQLVDIHPVHRAGELIIRIGEPDKRGKGLGSAALNLAICNAFTELDLNRVWLRVFATNARAIRAYEKVGFRREGVLRSACWIDEAWVDQVVMGILKSDTAGRL